MRTSPDPNGFQSVRYWVASAIACLSCWIGLVAAGPRPGQPAASNAPATQPSAKKPSQITEGCATELCHAAIIGRKVQHGPVAQKKCLACHEYDAPVAHRFRLVSQPGQLCQDCHALSHRTFVHAPLKDGRCTGCHDPHGSPFKALLTADPARGLCLTCHRQDFAAKKFVHAPLATGACILCHEAHSSSHAKLLTETPDKLCVGCHSELTPKGEAARHVHAPMKEANCTACHDAHASDIKYQLRQSTPDLCLSCHKETAKSLSESKVVHAAAHAGSACAECHAPHFSALPKLQKELQPQSCLACHDKAQKTEDGTTLANVAALLKENPVHHGPIRQGECTACHEPHAGENFRLLSSEYPPEFYAPFKIERYALCFKCHMPELVLDQQGTGRTRFRNGDVNLHWLHVNRAKGRTCRACHEVHASRQPFHIRESVPFGTKGWMLEIGFKQTETGGSCAPGCHDAQKYGRGDAQPAGNASAKKGGQGL